jgi:hypothetical protein
VETAQFCPSCGRRRGPDDRFCAGCGRPLDRPDKAGAAPRPQAGTRYPSVGADWSGAPRPEATRPVPPWERLKIVVPIAILAVGYWLISPLVWPALAPEPSVAEAPTATPRPVQPIAPPGLGAAPVSPSSTTTVAKPAGQGPAAGQPKGGTAVPAPTAVSSAATTVVGTPTPYATATPSVYHASPVDSLKVEAREVQSVRLGRLEAGTLVRMTFSVAFNSRFSSLTGVPDIDLFVVGPTGTVAAYPDARDGVRIAFEAPATGDYEVRLDNSKSRINAKRVGIQFG